MRAAAQAGCRGPARRPGRRRGVRRLRRNGRLRAAARIGPVRGLLETPGERELAAAAQRRAGRRARWSRRYRLRACSPYAPADVVRGCGRDRAAVRAVVRGSADPLRRELLLADQRDQPARSAALRRPQQHGPQPRGSAAVPRPPRRRVRALAAAAVSSTTVTRPSTCCATRSATSCLRACSRGATRSATRRPRRAGSPQPRRASGSRTILLDRDARSRGWLDATARRSGPARRAAGATTARSGARSTPSCGRGRSPSRSRPALASQR